MIKLGLFIKSLDISMNEHHFDRSDMIKVFQFFIHLIAEADKLNISEGQPYLVLPTSLICRAKYYFMSMQNGIRAEELLAGGKRSSSFSAGTQNLMILVRDPLAAL